MATAKQSADAATELATRLAEALLRERVVPRFVDSYVVEHGRYAVQVHASLYRDLLGLLQREALVTLTARALELAARTSATGGKGRGKSRPASKKDVAGFRRKFLAALARQQRWTTGDAFDFQRDLQMYEELIARNAATRRGRKAYQVANHPFVDRSAFLLDSSFLEKARVAASQALGDLEDLCATVTGSVLGEIEE